VLTVSELWRYPVKSLQGERIEQAVLTAAGIEGDRRFAIFDLDTGLGLTARRVPELLYASAQWNDDGSVLIMLPNGSKALDDEALSGWLGRRVELRSADVDAPRRYENPIDFEDEDKGGWHPFDGAGGAFHDSARSRVSLVSTGTLGKWDGRRFRANVYLDGEGEDALLGSQVSIGEAVIDIGKRIGRCVMTTRPQPGLARDLDVLRTINRERNGYLSVGALIVEPGTVRVGDTVTTV
jgi:uncharacterized protein